MKPTPPLESFILTIRRQTVILDSDLAALYEVPTKALNQAVKRNADRFPVDFCFQITPGEWEQATRTSMAPESSDASPNPPNEALWSQSVTTKRGGRRTPPYAFTEHGALMAAMVLNSPAAVRMSVYVVRAFVKQRELLMAQSDVLARLAQMDATLLQHDEALRLIWRELQPLLSPAPAAPPPPARKIGFNQKK